MGTSASTGQRGQASPEWLGLLLLVALALAALAGAGLRLPGAGLAQIVASRIACAAGIGSGCGEEGELVAAYGPELARVVADGAPPLVYEEGMRAVPVDFRSCRRDACAEGPEAGPVASSAAGEPVTAFVHVVDCREPAAAEGADCSGERAGRLYVQYWLYYPGSATARALLGERGAHPDDWESFQVRIDPGGERAARASSHHGYNGASGDWLSDAGLRPKPGWTSPARAYEISGGSHAGRIGERAPRSAGRRWTPADAIRLIPIEPLARDASWTFAVTPPWLKRVYTDPEYQGTD